ncbi:nitroimidazol reductase NimA-like FMN-containing flavoprotein (pyridoxamine 5'-phosphate oxidase superfamily) [Kibdelosporangium banguiense]|uniref:Nitroimidazol reductase NimA-like FMN-containing flavoprotein (Pyridoxamine 5'-phosphate oxidase superfamily) n=1 Tax=Kibdelosporangium banguiense TaxID=1365924 RepID=A0ABS4TIK8_9PSEU|nr:pyridoxamine 5'-phosphate oxidase family protein [Kibdelosporangium banguiense]MBP2323666.1 nitroimidazol reductase NimA-like FMN-containing flavoprotein (pyridoxamine 5'-phosphate oxidase superfamily) [Kibdelosporangium banguiense]
MTRPQLSPTPRSTIKRGKERAVADRAALDAVLDAGLICHLSVVIDGSPLVLPTGYGRDGDTLYLHGSSGALTLRTAALDNDICVAVTHLDGVVYARSMFHFSVNYRSAVVHGRARLVTDEAEKMHGLQVLTEHLAPGSWEHSRKPNAKEMAKTSVLAMSLAEASVKMRGGPPADEDEDIDANTAWAGVLPIAQRWAAPVPSPDLAPGWEIPAHVTDRYASRG